MAMGGGFSCKTAFFFWGGWGEWGLLYEYICIL